MPNPFPSTGVSPSVPSQSVTGYPNQTENGYIHQFNATVEGSSKLDVAMEAARGLLGSSHLQPDDTISLIQFDDRSQVYVDLRLKTQ